MHVVHRAAVQATVNCSNSCGVQAAMSAKLLLTATGGLNSDWLLWGETWGIFEGGGIEKGKTAHRTWTRGCWWAEFYEHKHSHKQDRNGTTQPKQWGFLSQTVS